MMRKKKKKENKDNKPKIVQPDEDGIALGKVSLTNFNKKPTNK